MPPPFYGGGMTNSGDLRALYGVRPGSWVRIDQDYYHFKGWGPDGARLVRLSRRPYGKTAYVLNADGTAKTEHVPGGVHASTAIFAIAAIAAGFLLPLLMAGQASIMVRGATIVSVAILALISFMCHVFPMQPFDSIEQAYWQQASAEAYQESQQLRAEEAVHQAQQAAYRAQQWQAATWAQTAAINASLNPGGDVYRPYGQSPPL